jgi:hypothetical protein
MEKPTDTTKYAEEILIQQQEFSSRLHNLRKHETAFSLFSTPFDVNVKSLQMNFSFR